MTYQTTQRGAGATTAGPAGSARNLVKAGDLQGRNIVGVDDEVIGTVDDLYLDYDEHTVRYCTVDVGGFLGIGAKTVLVPFEQLQWSGDELYLPVSKDTLEQAPEFDPDADYGRDYESDLSQVWGVVTYWEVPGYGADHSHWRQGFGQGYEDDRRPESRDEERSL